MTDSQRILELERQLADDEGSADGLRRIDILNELAWALSDTDLKRAYALSETAQAMATSPADGAPPYEMGAAYSLRTLGYLNQRLGNYPLGLSQLLKAQDICEALKLDDGLADVFDGLAGIYFQSGDFPEALNYMYRQFEVAQRSGDGRRIANAYNNLGNVYMESGDHERAIETFRQNLEIANEIGDGRIESLSHLNLAETYLLTGDGERALAQSLRGQEVSQQTGFELFEVYALQLIGKSYMKLGDPAQAIPYLDQALASSVGLESRVTEPLILLSLGEAYCDMGQPDRALEYLERGVAIAGSIDARTEMYKGHLLLSQLYERQGNLAQALEHFRQYHAVRELVFNEAADRRLKVLQVAHDTETARREAEILRLQTQQLEQRIAEQRKLEEALQISNDELERQVQVRTAELSDTVALLQREIAERERAEAEIQQMVETLEQRVAARTDELAAFFDLTVLAGQAVDVAELFSQALPRIIEVTRSRGVCIHLLDADRTTLRLAAQQNLSEDARTRLHNVELPTDSLRWLQRPNDPLLATTLTNSTALPPAFRLPELQTCLGAQIRIGRQIEGMLSCFRFTDRGYAVDEIALVTALAEQIGMMLETRRLRENAEAMAVVEERQRLARDLHDSVTQSLYSLSLFSRAGREAAEDGDADRLRHSLAELERNTLHTLREMRLLLYELRPADLEQAGLIQALELRLNTVERRASVELDVRLDSFPGLSRADEVQIYHIVVEALNNIVKHAAASRVTLHLTGADGHLHLLVADDGRGFDVTQTKGGLGLRNIRERVARLDGRLSISSQPGGGTRLEAVIPYQAEADR